MTGLVRHLKPSMLLLARHSSFLLDNYRIVDSTDLIHDETQVLD